MRDGNIWTCSMMRTFYAFAHVLYVLLRLPAFPFNPAWLLHVCGVCQDPMILIKWSVQKRERILDPRLFLFGLIYLLL